MRDGRTSLLLVPRKLYTDFPWIVDTLYPVIYDYGKDFACYDAVLSACSARRVLDLGCGTGLLARYLVQGGYDYTGVDLSPAMLALARRNVLLARWILCDMRDLRPLRVLPGGTFDAILSTGRSFAHLTRDEEVQTCLLRVFALLRPGGVFTCDCIDGNILPPDPVRQVTESTLVGSRTFRRDFTHRLLPGPGTSLDTSIHWRISEGDEVIAEFDDGQRHHAFNSNEMGRFLSVAGLGENLTSTHFPHQPVILFTSSCKTVA